MWFIIYFEIKHKKHATEYILMGGAYTMVNFFPLQHLTDRHLGGKKCTETLSFMDSCVSATAPFIFKPLDYL